MSFTTWIAAESFYNISLPIIIVIGLISFLVLTFVLSYVHWKKARYLVLFFVFGVAISSIYTAKKHQQYAAYLEEYSLLNPLIKDHRIIFGFPSYYSSRERQIYTRLHDIESLRKLSMYKEELIVEELQYLGKKDHYYYFDYNGQLFKTAEEVTFTKSTPYAQIIGSKFSLVDDVYQTIGFNKEFNTMFNTILVNENSKDAIYDPISGSSILSAEVVFSYWNF